jgi:hypothetical protein
VEELKRLQERQQAGELGLTEAEKTALRKAGEGQQLAISREMEAQQLQQMAAQPQAVSGRDIFLREQAAQTAMRTAAQQQEAAIMEANIAEREQELARIAALEGQAQQAEAQERAARAQAVSLGLAGAADVGMNPSSQTLTCCACIGPSLPATPLAVLYPCPESFPWLPPSPVADLSTSSNTRALSAPTSATKTLRETLQASRTD